MFVEEVVYQDTGRCASTPVFLHDSLSGCEGSTFIGRQLREVLGAFPN